MKEEKVIPNPKMERIEENSVTDGRSLKCDYTNGKSPETKEVSVGSMAKVRKEL